MKHAATAIALAAALLAGCATGGSTKKTPAYMATLRQKGVDPGTYARIANGRVLTYDDVEDLVEHGVPGDKIADYMKATRAPYKFTGAQIASLANEGASPALINFLRSAPTKPGGQGFDNPTTQAYLNSPYWTDPYYQDNGPMEFEFPSTWN